VFQYRPFEAADLIAYENLKANQTVEKNGGEAFVEDLRKPFQRLSKHSGGSNWRLFDLADLESTCKHFGVPERP